MDLGNKIKDMRLQLALTQEELADRCELTKGYISQLENDLTSPSIATLCDILSALGSSLGEFFNVKEEPQVVFTGKDFIEKYTDGVKLKWLIPNAQKNLMEPVIVELMPNTKTAEDFPHEGEEFGYVLEGKISLIIGKKAHTCKKGESFYFLADKVHYIFNKETKLAKFIWISSPPNF